MKNIRKMEQIARIVICVMITLSILLSAVTAAAEDQPVLSAGNVQGAAGTAVKMDISLSSPKDIAGLQFNIKYDKNLLDVKDSDVIQGSSLSGWMFDKNIIRDSGVIKVAAASSKGLGTNDTVIVCSINFTIKPGISNQTAAISVDSIVAGNSNAQKINVNSASGSVTVGDAPPVLPVTEEPVTLVTLPNEVTPFSPVLGQVYSKKFTPQDFSTANVNKELTFESVIASARLPVDMFTPDQLVNVKEITFNISSVDSTKLPASVSQFIGNHPIFEIYMEFDGRKTDWSNEKTPVTISIPYVPTADELKNTDDIIVYYMDGNGKISVVASGKYNSKSGMLTFSVTHFSIYGITFTQKTFDDIKNSWAKREIEALAVRGIINGTSQKTYSPDLKITRADFIKLLVGVLGKKAKVQDPFSDVNEKDYYYDAVNTAKALGLSKGAGNNRLDPKSNITRQDMMVLVNRALAISGKVLKDKADITGYADANSISDYAKESIQMLVAAKLIQGSGNKLRPSDNLTRAEASRVLYLVYKML